MYVYILSSGLYRLSCGALIIAINWLMTISNPSLGWLATTVALTFIPAMVVPLIWRGNNNSSSGFWLTQYSLLAAMVISLIMFGVNNQYLLLALNTVIWFFFFVMESSWESWFTSECKGLEERAIEKFSSVTMSVNQAALMIGPIIAAYIFEHNPKQVILACAALYLFCFVVVKFLAVAKPEPASQKQSNLLQNEMPSRLSITGIEISLLLIWPTLAMFNFMLPAQVAFRHGSMTDVGLLDALMGVGMIVSGVLITNPMLNKLLVKYKLNIVFIFVAMLLWNAGDNLIYKLFSVFLLGMSFNNQRIYIRSQLAKKYSPKQVGKIVSSANGFSFILISLSLFAFHDNNTVNWMIPFLFSLIIGVMVSLKIKGNKYNSYESEM